MSGWSKDVLRSMILGRLDGETLRRIQRGEKDPDRFEKVREIEQERVPWSDRILVPLQEHLYIVEKPNGETAVKCACGQEFGDPRRNWKLSSLVYERDPGDGEVLSPDRAVEADWMIFREFFCPGCGAQLEVEAVPPGHPIVFSALPDLGRED